MALTSRPALLLPVIFCAVSAPAHAEGERALSVGLGWATFSTPGEPAQNMEPTTVTPDIGGALGVSYEHAIGSDFSLRAESAGSLFYGGTSKDDSTMSYALLGDAGITFRFDVLKYVPYAFAGVGGLMTWGGPIDTTIAPVLSIGGGLDILVDRATSWGIEGRLVSFGGDVTIFTLGVRATSRWGYF